MNHGKLVFAQLIDFVPIKKFRLCVKRYGGDHRVRNFTCWDQFLCMAFAQLTYRESLRDIEVCLRTKSKKLYHLGIRGTVARTTIARANDRRDWRIYRDFAMVLIDQARTLYSQDPLSVRLKRAVYALDSTTIDLCLSIFPWASFRSTKAAVKLHTLIDLRGNIPSVIVISRGNMHDVNILDKIVFEAAAIYIMDRAYLDYARLYRITQASAFFDFAVNVFPTSPRLRRTSGELYCSLSPARGAYPTAFTGEGDQERVLAAIAVHSGSTMSEDSAV